MGVALSKPVPCPQNYDSKKLHKHMMTIKKDMQCCFSSRGSGVTSCKRLSRHKDLSRFSVSKVDFYFVVYTLTFGKFRFSQDKRGLYTF